MASKKDKKPFKWEAGSRLDQDAYDPVGGIREVGFVKLADGIYADPAKRKEARKVKLTAKPKLKEKEEFVLEESESGLHNEFTPSEASRLIRKDSKSLKGISRFGKKPGSK